jgi:hypothetical protein
MVSAVFAVFTVGYILGVWTACLVFRQTQRESEEGVPAARSGARLIALGSQSRASVTPQ